MRDERSLTEGETDVMEAVWTLGEAPVRAILDALPSSRPLAYTSVATFLKILESKGFLASREEGRRRVYRATLSREAYLSGSVRRLTERWYGGNPTGLLRQLVSEGLSSDEATALRALLDAAERKP